MCSRGSSTAAPDGGDAVETPIGFVPAPGAIDTDGLDSRAGTLDELLAVDADRVAGGARR